MDPKKKQRLRRDPVVSWVSTFNSRIINKKKPERKGSGSILSVMNNDYIIPSIPPIPPWLWPPFGSSFGSSAIMHEVVRARPATEAAF